MGLNFPRTKFRDQSKFQSDFSNEDYDDVDAIMESENWCGLLGVDEDPSSDFSDDGNDPDADEMVSDNDTDTDTDNDSEPESESEPHSEPESEPEDEEEDYDSSSNYDSSREDYSDSDSAMGDAGEYVLDSDGEDEPSGAGSTETG